MRQLATLPSATAAQTLADYLLTRQIQTRVLREPEGWAVWVCDEDRLPQAREEFDQFQQNPSDERFAAATQVAEQVRRQQRRIETEYQRRDSRFRRKMYGQEARPVTLFLIIASVCIFFIAPPDEEDTGPSSSAVTQSLRIASIVRFEGGYAWRRLAEIEEGQVWRLVTPIFLHANLLHISFNMFLLYQLGSVIERKRGSWRLALMVLLIAIGSNVTQYFLTWDGQRIVFHPNPHFGGMSGVVYGLFGYALVKGYAEPDLGMQLNPSAVSMLLIWFVLCFFPAFERLIGVPVANMAHAGGLLGGVLIGLAGYAWRQLRQK